MEQNTEKVTANESRNAYMRKWRKENPDKVKKNNLAYWLRRAQRENNGNDGSNQ